MESQMSEKETVELKEIIEKSIFSDEKKSELLSMVDRGQTGDDFFNKIEHYFSEYLKNKQEKYQKGISEMDQGFDEIDEFIHSKRDDLEKALEAELMEVDVLDTKTRGEIWKKYYKNLTDLNREHEEKIKAFSSSTLAAMIS
jgi:hypothetical protein